MGYTVYVYLLYCMNSAPDNCYDDAQTVILIDK